MSQIMAAKKPTKRSKILSGKKTDLSASALNSQEGGNHYKKYKIQPVEYCHANHLEGIESQVIGYVTRHRDKGGAQDIKKAIHFLELLLEMEYAK